MKRFFALLLCFCLVGMVAAYNTENYPEITPENAMNLQEVTVLGNGAMNDALAWLPNGGVVVGGTRGLYLFETLEAEPEFIALGTRVDSLLLADETLFFGDDRNLYAYDLANQEILYSLEGQMPLAVSHDRQLLAYEVAMGVRVLEIATGQLRYDFSYEGILESEDTILYPYSGGEPYNNENEFIFAQFYPDDSGLIVRWTSGAGGGRYWEGNGSAGTDLWNFASKEPVAAVKRFPAFAESEFELQSFVGIDARGNYFAMDETALIRLDGQLSLNLILGEYLVLDNSYYPFALSGNLFAAFGYFQTETGANEHMARVWDIRSGEHLVTISARGKLLFSPDGSKIAVGTAIYSLDSGELIRELLVDHYNLLLDGSNRILLFSHDGTFRLLDTANIAVVAILPIRQEEWDYEGSLRDGSLIFYNRFSDGLLRVDEQTGEEIARIPDLDTKNYHVLFNSDSTYVFAIYNGEQKLWDLSTGERILLPEQYRVAYPYVNKAGALIVWDEASQQVHFYDPGTPAILASFNAERGNLFEPSIYLSDDGRYMLLLTGETELALWSLATNSFVRTVPYNYWTVAISPNSLYLAFLTEDHEVNVMRISDGEITTRFQIPDDFFFDRLRFVSDTVLALVPYNYWLGDLYINLVTSEEFDYRYSEQDYLFAQTAELSFYRLWEAIRIDAEHEQLPATYFTEPSISYAALSSDGTKLLVSYWSGTVSIWAVQN